VFRCMPSHLLCLQAAVVLIDIGVFGRFRSLIQYAIQNEESIDLRCSGNKLAMAIVEVETTVIHRFSIVVHFHLMRL
jgi:hypothetical protein